VRQVVGVKSAADLSFEGGLALPAESGVPSRGAGRVTRAARAVGDARSSQMTRGAHLDSTALPLGLGGGGRMRLTASLDLAVLASVWRQATTPLWSSQGLGSDDPWKSHW